VIEVVDCVGEVGCGYLCDCCLIFGYVFVEECYDVVCDVIGVVVFVWYVGYCWCWFECCVYVVEYVILSAYVISFGMLFWWWVDVSVRLCIVWVMLM